jgi:drug/metabolite transporter superfamily protein YnfA
VIEHVPDEFILNGLEPEYLSHGVDWIASNFNITCPGMHKNLQETAKYGFYKSFNADDSYGRNVALSHGIYVAVKVAMYMFANQEDIHNYTLSGYWIDAWGYAADKMKEIYAPESKVS